MPIIRKFAVQGHYVPRTAAPARGPFPPGLFAPNPRAEEHFPKADSLHEALDDVKYFRCKECGEIMLDSDMESHLCVDSIWEVRRATNYRGSESNEEELSLFIGSTEGRPIEEYED